MLLAEGCRRVMPVIVENDEVAWDLVLLTLERWGDRRIPHDPNWDGLLD